MVLCSCNQNPKVGLVEPLDWKWELSKEARGVVGGGVTRLDFQLPPPHLAFLSKSVSVNRLNSAQTGNMLPYDFEQLRCTRR